jgi:uncharacterized phage protein (TIGR01671 family)
MKREIKFRAWDEQAQQMKYPEDTVSSSANILKYYSVVMQFTGLKDKNGVEIYEGDWLNGLLLYRHSDTGTLPTMGAVEYDESFGAFGIKNDSGVTFFVYHLINSFEVIGNIYEHPHLLTHTNPEV